MQRFSPPAEAEGLGKWLIWLRWCAIAAQVVVLGIVVFWLGLSVSLPVIASLFSFEVLSNAALSWWVKSKPMPESTLAWIMAVDVILLTVLLQATGGPFNPFTLMYLVHVTIAALTLSFRWVAALSVVSLGAYGALFSPWLWDPHAHHMHHGAALTLHLEGMWWALAVTAILIILFVMGLRRLLAEQEDALRRVRELQEQESRLTALATLAAGAAHELATPLSTIAVVAKELELALQSERPELGEDARLVNFEVARCRRVLSQLSLDAGAMMGEVSEPISVVELSTAIMEDLSDGERVRVEIDDDASSCSIYAPRAGLAQIVRGVVRNGLQAGESEVLLRFSKGEEGVVVLVKDEGKGMDAETKARIFEPFFTTREHGQGMGLGLFLAYRMIRDLGGQIHVESDLDSGTTVRIEIPCERRK